MRHNICNVSDVYAANLCSGCGVCTAVCPKQSISYEYDANGLLKPLVSKNCINCGICLSMCPGYAYSEEKFKSISKSFVVHSTSEETRKNSASGGFITELLCYLINEDIVDYCCIIPKVRNSLVVKPILTDKIEEITEAKGSKYIPTQYGKVLDTIKRDKEHKYAIVILPCQLRAVRKYLGEEMRRVIPITLMCNHATGISSSQYLIDLAGSPTEYRIDYRGDGWPGTMRVNDKKIGDFRSLYKGTFGRLSFPLRCRLCDEHMGERSEITCADPYFLGERNGLGNTYVISRSEIMNGIIKDMISKGVIEDERVCVSEEELHDSYKGIYVMYSNVSDLLNILKMTGKKLPLNYENKLKGRLSLNGIVNFLKIKRNQLKTHMKVSRYK